MQIMYARCAGLDVHKKTVVACVRLVADDGSVSTQVRTFGTMTVDLLALLDWLVVLEVTHVAMESTGELWKPVYNLLESALTILVVNAQHIKHVPGRKTDVKDAEWIADLLAHGLLRASFVPPAPQRMLRDLTRQRTALIQERARVVQRMQKVLEWANLKLSAVVTDITGVSARAMLTALVGGQTDVSALVGLAKGSLRTKREALEQALRGTLQPHHTFMIARHLGHLDFLEEEIATFDAEIAQALEEQGKPPPAGSSMDVGQGAAALTGSGGAPERGRGEAAAQLVDSVPGIGRRVAEIILAEIGTDMRRFADAGHLASWARLSPGQHESAGKRQNSRIGSGNRYLRSALIQAAHAGVKQKGSSLAAFYQRVAARRGKKKAIVAVAHKLVRIIYHLLTTGEPYLERGAMALDERQKDRLLGRLQQRIVQLGYTVHLEPAAATAA
jgi:transposase